MQKIFKATIEEVGNPNPLHPVYYGDENTTLDFVEKFWGLHDKDIKSYNVEVEYKDLDEENAIRVAAAYGLTYEVQECLKAGLTPEQALREWDIV